MSLRKALFMGSWYPAKSNECEKLIKEYLKDYKKCSRSNIVGGVVPHAGWYFSGSIACNVIYNLSLNKKPDVFIIMGMHLQENSLPYITNKGAFETPFGNINVDEELAQELLSKFNFIVEDESNFIPDNTIEVNLPFIKYFFPDTKILSLGIMPNNDCFKIADYLLSIIKKQNINFCIVASTDLTHYGKDYGFCNKESTKEALEFVKEENDKKIIDAILNLDEKLILKIAKKYKNACCSGSLACMVSLAKNFTNEKPEVIAYSTSYDKHKSDNFVSYVGCLI